MDHKTLNIFEKECFMNITEGLKLAKCMKVNIDVSSGNEINELNKRMDELCISDTLFCSFCNMAFEDKVRQREHYKLDWHRYNLKQSLMGRSMVSEEEFQQLADDVSSISGSESDSEDDDEEDCSDASPSKRKSNDANDQKDSAAINKLQVERHSKVFFENADGKILSVYRCILQEKKNALEDSQLVTSLMKSIDKPSWTIIMLGGGHFAAGVFEGSEPVVHKTFHSYTVRARQGGTQSSRDGRSGGSHPKSAGASLRRYNEASFNQHVQDILTEWTNHLEACSLILCRAVGHNRSLLFGGRHPTLNRNDSRVRTIPFPTRRATFKEVQRIHKMLSSIEVYGSADKFQTSFPQSPKKIQQKSSPDRKTKLTEADVSSFIPSNENCEEASEINEVQGDMRPPRQKKKFDRSKARPSPSRPLPEVVTSILAESSPQESDEGEPTWISEDQEVSFVQDLKEYEDTVPPSVKEKKRRKFNKDKEKKKQNRPLHPKEKVSEAVRILREKLIAACKLSNTTFLQECLESSTDTQRSNNEKCSKEVSHEELLKCLNEHVTDNGSTLLHIAAENGNTVIVRSLLEAGCDPSLKNKKAQPPFAVSADRETRHTFRKFMGEFPEKYDYRKSQIPGPLTDEMEQQLVEKKKEVKKVKRDRQKDKKREETEMDRFLKLSDREKRALAAERRIIANNAQGKSDFKVVSRCFECAADISGKVPFEYDIHRFCTMDCLKKHRLKMKMQCQQK